MGVRYSKMVSVWHWELRMSKALWDYTGEEGHLQDNKSRYSVIRNFLDPKDR